MEKRIDFCSWGGEDVVIVAVYDGEQILDYREYAWPDMQLLRTTSYEFDGKGNVRQGEEIVYDKEGVRRFLFNYTNDVLDGEQIEYHDGFPAVRLYYKRGQVHIIEKYDHWDLLTERIVYNDGDDLERHTWFYPGTEIIAQEKGKRKVDWHWYPEDYYEWARHYPLNLEKVAIPFGFYKNRWQIEKHKSNHVYKYFSKWANRPLNGNYEIYYGNTYFMLSFKDGLIEGVVKELSNNGVLLSTVEYKGGLKHGKSCWYNPDGTVKKIEEFRHGKRFPNKI